MKLILNTMLAILAVAWMIVLYVPGGNKFSVPYASTPITYLLLVCSCLTFAFWISIGHKRDQ